MSTTAQDVESVFFFIVDMLDQELDDNKNLCILVSLLVSRYRELEEEEQLYLSSTNERCYGGGS